MGKYEDIGNQIGKMVDEKQAAYGDSFGNAGNVLKILYPNGIQIDQYDDMLAAVRIIDKLFRIANDRSAFGENPYKDIAGYGILGSASPSPSASSIVLSGSYDYPDIKKKAMIPPTNTGAMIICNSCKSKVPYETSGERTKQCPKCSKPL